MDWKDDGKSFSEGFLEGQYFRIMNDEFKIKDFGGLAKMQSCTLSLHAKRNDLSYRRSDRKRKQEKGAEQLYEGVEHR